MTDATQNVPASSRAVGPILAGRATMKWDSPDLVGQIVAELTTPPGQSRQLGRQGLPSANSTRELPATLPAKRLTAVRGLQLRSHRIDVNAGQVNWPIEQRGNFVRYHRSELGPAGVLVRFDDPGSDAVYLAAGQGISGALFDRLYVTADVAAGGFVTLLVTDDPRADLLRVG